MNAMPAIMPAFLPARGARPTFLTPLGRDDLFEPGQVFRPADLTRRVLSVFWRDCCCPPCFSRAPAPVLELCGERVAPGQRPARLRAWWLLHDGILEDREGPYTERLRPFFDRAGTAAPIWPCYEFRVLTEPMAVEMIFHQHSFSRHGHRTNLSVRPNGDLCVTGRAPPDAR
jgi:hypothetical protein